MKFISAIHMLRRNFWCMTRGVCDQKKFNSRREMEDSQEARTWWKQWIWVEKLIFPVSVTQKEQLSGVFIFEFNFDANLAPPRGLISLNQKTSFTKYFSLDPKNLNPDVEIQNPNFAFYHPLLILGKNLDISEKINSSHQSMFQLMCFTLQHTNWWTLL